MLNISIIKCLTDNYSYLLKDEITNTVGIVDPSEFTTVDKEIERKYKKLDFIINTHHHDDHIGGNLELKEKYNSKIVCSFHDKGIIKNTDINLRDGDKFSFGKTDFQVIHIPGHTLGHVAFYSKSAKVIFSGDTLFSLGCGRIFEGSFEQMFSSIEKIKNLPSDTLIYCGHEYTEKNGEFAISIDDQNKILKEKIKNVASKIKGLDNYMVGTMMEIPRASFVADRIAETAEFFSFGTNDLTQMAFGFSRDDTGGFMPAYLENELLPEDPFASLDEGVCELVKMGIERGRKTKPDLKVGICGEHGGEPKSVHFCHGVGMDYVSCSPFRVPIARLAAAQAVLNEK